jgi:hypothetical protein
MNAPINPVISPEAMEFTSSFFDSSSRAWLANKKRNDQSYKYKCGVEDCPVLTKASANCKKHAGQGILLIHKGPMTRATTKKMSEIQ